MSWRPIETAPQDGTWVWTFTPSRVPQQTAMRWMPGVTREQSKWITDDYQWYVFGPTHWVSFLPPPRTDITSPLEKDKNALGNNALLTAAASFLRDGNLYRIRVNGTMMTREQIADLLMPRAATDTTSEDRGT